MGQTALYAPAHRVQAKSSAPGNVPKDACQPLDYLGNGLQDHRLSWNRKSAGLAALGWFGSDPVLALNQAPAALGTAKIAALANVVSGVPMTLAGASTGITVVPAATLLVPALTTPPANSLALDGLALTKLMGESFVVGYYDRNTFLSRAVSVTGVAGGSGGNFLVSGYDVYGYAMSELITVGAGAVTGNGKKAFKIVSSVVPQFTNAFNYSVGTLDIFGLPLRTESWGEVLLQWNDAMVTVATGFTAANAVSPATTTTADNRGTYAVQTAADGVKKLVARISPSLTRTRVDPTTGLFGLAQV